SQIANRVSSDAFGIYEAYREREASIEFSYICSVEVADFDDVPAEMIKRTIPQHLYAAFRHTGPLSSLPETLKYIWGSWLPKSKYEYVEKPDFELYAADTRSDDLDKSLFLYIPIRPREVNAP
ncbi:MAG: AraC family transcriptional regulator, partial [Candidatus Azotimanducaceae bacterium]